MRKKTKKILTSTMIGLFAICQPMAFIPYIVYAAENTALDQSDEIPILNMDGNTSMSTSTATISNMSDTTSSDDKEPADTSENTTSDNDIAVSTQWSLVADAGGIIVGENDTVTFTATAGDIKDTKVTLYIDGGTAQKIGTMKDDGTSGDQIAADGIYTIVYSAIAKESSDDGLNFYAQIDKDGNGTSEKTPDINIKILPQPTDEARTIMAEMDATIQNMAKGYSDSNGKVYLSKLPELMDMLITSAQAWKTQGLVIYESNTDKTMSLQMASGLWYTYTPDVTSESDTGTGSTRWVPDASQSTTVPFSTSANAIRFEIFYYTGDKNDVAAPTIQFQGNGVTYSNASISSDNINYLIKRGIKVSGCTKNVYYDVYYLVGKGISTSGWTMQVTTSNDAEMLIITPSDIPDNWNGAMTEYKTAPSEPILWMDRSADEHWIPQISNIIAEEAVPEAPQAIVPEAPDRTAGIIKLVVITVLFVGGGIFIITFLNKRGNQKIKEKKHSAAINRANDKFRKKSIEKENDLDGYIDDMYGDTDDGDETDTNIPVVPVAVPHKKAAPVVPDRQDDDDADNRTPVKMSTMDIDKGVADRKVMRADADIDINPGVFENSEWGPVENSAAKINPVQPEAPAQPVQKKIAPWLMKPQPETATKTMEKSVEEQPQATAEPAKTGIAPSWAFGSGDGDSVFF